MSAALTLDALSAGYGDVVIVREFSCALPRGSVTTLIGGNGAGKSTLLKAIYGTAACMGGRVLLGDQAIQTLPPWERLARGIGLVPQGRCNFPQMTVEENLLLGCTILPGARHGEAIERVLAVFPMLRAKWRTIAGNLSGGEQQILETAMVMIPDPRVLLLDEPSLGLSPKMQDEVFAMVRAVAAGGVTVLMVEQNVRGALLASDTALVLELGRKFLEGPAAAVAVDPRIRQAYLGGNIETE